LKWIFLENASNEVQRVRPSFKVTNRHLPSIAMEEASVEIGGDHVEQLIVCRAQQCVAQLFEPVQVITVPLCLVTCESAHRFSGWVGVCFVRDLVLNHQTLSEI
jgi:hypothetical protein